MLPTREQLRDQLGRAIERHESMGYDMAGLTDRLDKARVSYDELVAVGLEAMERPRREDWAYVEPEDIEGIRAECDPQRCTGPLDGADAVDQSERVRAGFLSSVCGCVLGKPVEVQPSLAELRDALSATGDWPLDDYIPMAALEKLGRHHPQSLGCTRERLCAVVPDDDLNYSILGMLVLEEHGRGFTREHVADCWRRMLPVGWTFGPERKTLAQIAVSDCCWPRDSHPLVRFLLVGDTYCGAQIRADAYGYAAAGRPELAADLAWRDAGLNHVGTGLYATLWTAAAIATACVVRDPVEVFRTATRYIPQRSRFAEAIRKCIELVEASADWLAGYERIHAAFGEYGHCRVLQESGTMINAVAFAENTGQAICRQVMQGNDTDSYGATCGSLAGCLFGPDGLEDRWLAPLNDTIYTTLAEFHEQRLSAVADRMAALPRRLAGGS